MLITSQLLWKTFFRLVKYVLNTFIMLSSISFYNFEINSERFSFSTQPRIYTFGDISQKPGIFAKKYQHNASIYNFQHNHIIIRSVTFQRNLWFSPRRVNIMHQWTIIFDVTNFMTFEIRGNMFSLFNRILLFCP